MDDFEQLAPSAEDVREAVAAVESRGWTRSHARGHAAYPVGIREPDGSFKPCEVCGAARNPARWPLFFRSGSHAGRVLWTCSTCKLAHADAHGRAVVLVSPPAV